MRLDSKPRRRSRGQAGLVNREVAPVYPLDTALQRPVERLEPGNHRLDGGAGLGDFAWLLAAHDDLVAEAAVLERGVRTDGDAVVSGGDSREGVAVTALGNAARLDRLGEDLCAGLQALGRRVEHRLH